MDPIIEMLALPYSIAIHRCLALSQLHRGLLKDEAGLTFLHVSACGENACAVDMGRCKCGWKKQMRVGYLCER